MSLEIIKHESHEKACQVVSGFTSCPHCLEKDGESTDVRRKGNSKSEAGPAASSLFKDMGSSQDAQRDKPAG